MNLVHRHTRNGYQQHPIQASIYAFDQGSTIVTHSIEIELKLFHNILETIRIWRLNSRIQIQ